MGPDLAHETASAALPILDLGHLARMTFGDQQLQDEVLTLFARQSAELLKQMREATGPTIGTLAHRLAGSASGVGAWQVAAACRSIEEAGAIEVHSPLFADLQIAVDDACSAIARLRRDNRVKGE